MRSVPQLILLTLSLIGWSQYASAGSYKSIVHLDVTNPGDVYLVSNLIVCVHAYEKMKDKSEPELNSPLGLLASKIYAHEYKDHVYFYNKTTGRLLLIIRLDKITNYCKDIQNTLKLNRVTLDYLFNELIGINNLIISSFCTELYDYFANILSEIVGVGCEATGLLNLSGLLNYSILLPENLCVFSPRSPLGRLHKIRDQGLLIRRIASKSILLDAAAYWNLRYIFQDSVSPVQTCSGYYVGSLIGNKELKKTLQAELQALVMVLPKDAQLILLVRILDGIALDGSLELRIAPLYNESAAPAYLLNDEMSLSIDGVINTKEEQPITEAPE